jgi:peptidoglycan-associated lipoprotein
MSFEHLSSERDCPFVSLVTCFALAAATLVTGCAKHETSSEAEAPMGLTSSQESIAVRAPQSQTAQTPQSTTTTSSATLEVGPDLTKACDLKVNSIESAPKFDFDQSVLLPEDRDILDQIAKCVTTGPLQGQHLHLIGRADPRGEIEYNMVLGGSRADSVRNYLIGLGVPGSNVTETSRGKLDATGTDEATWRLDRRVDVDLQ